MYLIGGFNDFNEAVSDIEVFDWTKNTWNELPDLPFTYECRVL